MALTDIAYEYLARFKTKHGYRTTADQWSALNAIMGCRTEQYGTLAVSCSQCDWHTQQHRSCGHRSCNRCQNHATTQWLERQQRKLLPVDYFMVTFTLPSELRGLAKANQRVIYALLFDCAVATLKTFGLNEKGLAAEFAMTGVLHTHSRRLDYHPHVHMVVPGGGVNTRRNEWRKVKGDYLFNGHKLAIVFKAKLLTAIQHAGLSLPMTPKKWVVQCQRVGRGLPAIKYLSRYLYRGVISNHSIVSDDGDTVTFSYKDSRSGETRMRSLAGEDFIALILQHTLPKGFRRARDYGFLHGNAKKLLQRVQWLLQVSVPIVQQSQRPAFICKACSAPMAVVGFISPASRSG